MTRWFSALMAVAALVVAASAILLLSDLQHRDRARAKTANHKWKLYFVQYNDVIDVKDAQAGVLEERIVQQQDAEEEDEVIQEGIVGGEDDARLERRDEEEAQDPRPPRPPARRTTGPRCSGGGGRAGAWP